MRRADNLLPVPRGLVSRPGAVQVIAGDVSSVLPFGGALLFARGGRLWAYEYVETDIGPVLNPSPTGTAYQALTTLAQREPRLYLAPGGGAPLYYVTRGPWQRRAIVNTVKADSGAPYPLPAATAVAAWRGRLWVSAGGNRVHHCELDAPATWDPLYTLEFQTGRADGIRALVPHRDALVVALADSLWSVTGDSQYNWQRLMLVDGRGVQSPAAIVSDGERLIYLARRGLYQLGESQPLTGERLEPLFDVPDPDAALLLDDAGQYLYALLHGRLLVLNTADWRCGEILAPGRVRGLFKWNGTVGWFGPAGVWIGGAEDQTDIAVDGTVLPVLALLESWDDMPNPRGRAVLARCVLDLAGTPRGPVRYEVAVDGVSRVARLLDVAPAAPSATLQAWDGVLKQWPAVPVRHDVPVHAAGTRFVQRISSVGHLEIYAVDPQYQFGAEKEESSWIS